MENSADARPAQTYREAEDALLSRWPETRLDPTLDRIQAFMEVLGEPQRSYPSIHLTGTNGKTSTARMVEALVAATGLRVGHGFGIDGSSGPPIRLRGSPVEEMFP